MEEKDPHNPLAIPYWSFQVDLTKPPISTSIFGTTYYGSYRGADVVIKTLHLERVDTKDIIRQLQNSASLSHPHIATLYGMCIDEERGVFLVLENMTGGCLFDKLRSHTFNAALKMRMLLEIASAISYVHKQNMIHRDIKSLNILLTGDYSRE